MQPAPSDTVPEDSAALIMSVQEELAQLGYYHGPIDGIAGPQTARAVRWFQSVDKLPLSGQIDGATLKALPDRMKRNDAGSLHMEHEASFAKNWTPFLLL